jgi:hypothetical protein
MYKRGQKEEEGSHRGNNSTGTGIRERAEWRAISPEAGWFHGVSVHCLLRKFETPDFVDISMQYQIPAS